MSDKFPRSALKSRENLVYQLSGNVGHLPCISLVGHTFFSWSLFSNIMNVLMHSLVRKHGQRMVSKVGVAKT